MAFEIGDRVKTLRGKTGTIVGTEGRSGEKTQQGYAVKLDELTKAAWTHINGHRNCRWVPTEYLEPLKKGGGEEDYIKASEEKTGEDGTCSKLKRMEKQIEKLKLENRAMKYKLSEIEHELRRDTLFAPSLTPVKDYKQMIINEFFREEKIEVGDIVEMIADAPAAGLKMQDKGKVIKINNKQTKSYKYIVDFGWDFKFLDNGDIRKVER